MDEGSVEETKRQIRNLVNEISNFSKSEMPGEEYYPAVLHRIVQALAATGGAIWLLDAQSSMRLAYQIKVHQNLLEQGGDEAMQHARLLSRVMSKGQGELIPPRSVFGDDQSMGNPTDSLLVLFPLIAGKKISGLLEIFQRADSPPETQRGYLRFLEHMAKLIGEWLKGQSLQEVSDRQQLWQQSDQFARLVHDNLSLRDTAFTIANEGRRLIDCDRVSVATMKGNHAKVISISGQDTIESRSNIVTSLNLLATRVVRSREPLWYDGTTEELPPQLEEAVQDYVDLSHGRTISVLPIYRPEKTVEGDIQAKKSMPTDLVLTKEIIGALIVEQIETQLPKAELEGRVDLVYEHACRALSNSLTHEQLFLMPVWRALGRATWFFRGSTLPKTLGVIGLVLIGLIAMFIVHLDFDLQGNGTMAPQEEKHIFAHVDGQIEDVPVEHGDEVQVGDVLVKLRNRDLEVQKQEIAGQLQVTNEGIRNIPRQLSGSSLNVADRSKLERELSELKIKRESLNKQLALINEKEGMLVRTSPIHGIVTTWDVQNVLKARPVAFGQILMTVAETDGVWEIEVLMPEKRMRYLDDAMKKAEDEAGKTGKEGFLPVEFILMTEPNTTRMGKLYRKNIQHRSEVDAEDGSVVRLRVTPDSMEGLARPGAKVKADVKCGRRTAAFVWFYEVIEWIRANLLF